MTYIRINDLAERTPASWKDIYLDRYLYLDGFRFISNVGGAENVFVENQPEVYLDFNKACFEEVIRNCNYIRAFDTFFIR